MNTYSSHTVILGFSFSLEEDGSPGVYNFEIADRIKRHIMTFSKPPLVLTQWEIYDALTDLEDDQFDIRQFGGKELTVSPPSFHPEEIENSQMFIDFLKKGKLPSEKILWKKLNTIFSGNHSLLVEENLIEHLNRLLVDPFLFSAFTNVLELPDLRRWVDPPNPRPELGYLGLEKRCLPDFATYPDGLRFFQAQRINRLIIETIIPETILKRGEYLGVGGVLNQAMKSIDPLNVNEIYVYGHPAHQHWCLLQTKKRLGAYSHIQTFHGLPGKESITWNRQAAQLWCRSEANWKAYISIKP